MTINPKPKKAKYITYLKTSFFEIKNLTLFITNGKIIKKRERKKETIKTVTKINTE
jgi:hypothetical protein